MVALDATQTIVKNKHGYSNSQMIGYKIIYDFISRFSHAGEYEGQRYTIFDIKFQDRSGALHRVPLNTHDILEKIGLDRIGLYFSPQEYPKRFEDFCRKMYGVKAQPADFVVPGVMIYDKIVVDEVVYGGAA